MHNLLTQYVWLVPLLPLLASTWIAIGYIAGCNRSESGEKQTSLVSLLAISLSLVWLLLLDINAAVHGPAGQIQLSPWLVSGDYRVYISFTLDSLGLVMATLVASIAMLTTKFSINYMHREAGYQRFFMIMGLFSSGMLLIVMAGNAVLTFIGWELAGVSSYLLIAYAFDRPNATANANQAFITNRIGDAGFIIAIAFSFIWLGGVEWTDILEGKMGVTRLHIGLIAGGFLLAAMAKSALVPFSSWIAKALEGPTPSSAIFYGSLMVHAGIYLIIRLEPLIMQDTALLPLLLFIGVITAIYGFFTGLVQTDVKSSLMFSVTFQAGLMLVLCGMALFHIATIYLVLHAIWRAYQFLLAPSHMHLISQPTREISPSIKRWQLLYTASLQRFWLDHLARWLLVNPVKNLSRDMRSFEDKVVTRIVGLPAQASTVSSLGHMEPEDRVGKGRGLAGGLMQWLASGLSWFEEHLVLKSSDESLLRLIQHLGQYVVKIDELLSQPRYLLILIIASFVVIL